MRKKAIHNYQLVAVLALLCCILFLPCFRVKVLANELETSIPISTDGTNYTGLLTEEEGANYYRFILESSGRINLVATAKMRWINYHIYNEAGEQIWHIDSYWNDTTKQSATNESIDLVKGSYYFVVREPNYTGNYSFKLQFTNAGESFADTQYSEQSNDSMDTASNIVLNTGYKGQIALNDLKDFYRFTLESSGRINLVATAEMKWINYHIYNEAGEQIWHIDSYWNDTTKQSVTNESIDLVRGSYYFVVREPNYTGNYSFQLNFTDAGESFPNVQSEGGSDNSLDTANPIVAYTEYKGQIALNDSKDFYRFTLDSADRVRLIAEIGIRRVYFRIYNEMGNQVWGESYYWNDATRKINIDKNIDLEAGVYYLVVEDNGYSGNYTFQLTKYVETPMLSTLSNLSSGIKLEWEPSIGANGYQIYRKTGSGKWKRVKTTAASSWTDKKAVENGTRYQYRIYAYSGTVKSNWSEIKTIYRLTAPTLSSVKSNSSYSLTAKWKKNGQASGYEVWYKPQGNTDYWYVDVPGKNTGSRAINGLYSEKYDVCVRSYKTVKGVKYYSAVSKAKRVKIKK